MRIALLSYRSKTHCGGQGVYVRHLSRGLVELGHEVEVFSGQPYPEGLDPRVRLTKVPSLDLYREPDPFRDPATPRDPRPRPTCSSSLTTWTGRLPRAADLLPAGRADLCGTRADEFDVVHDNQSLGVRAADVAQARPAGGRHDPPPDHPRPRRRRSPPRRGGASRWSRRWYGFAAMQKQVARRIPELLTVSSSSAVDIADDFGVAPDQLHVVPLGVDTELFRPRRRTGCPAASSRSPAPTSRSRASAHLLARRRAAAAVERDLDVQLVSKLEPNGPTEKLIAELGISDIVHSRSGLTDDELADLLASAEVACIPSLYEGFSLPAVEAMASGTPIVASRAGALPEVVGEDGVCARLVDPATSTT